MRDHHEVQSPSDPSGEGDAWFEVELERRLQRLLTEDNDVHDTSAFSGVDYLAMVIVGIVFPILAIYIGWR